MDHKSRIFTATNGMLFILAYTASWATPLFRDPHGQCTVWECQHCYSLAIRCELHAKLCEVRNVAVPIIANSTINVVAPTIPNHDDDLSWRNGD